MNKKFKFILVLIKYFNNKLNFKNYYMKKLLKKLKLYLIDMVIDIIL